MNIETRVSHYLNNEKDLYATWYQSYLESKYGQADIEFTSGKWSLEQLVEFFNEWLSKNLKSIRKLICPTYVKIQQTHQNEMDVIVAMADILKSSYDFYPELSVLLVKHGIDKICELHE